MMKIPDKDVLQVKCTHTAFILILMLYEMDIDTLEVSDLVQDAVVIQKRRHSPYLGFRHLAEAKGIPWEQTQAPLADDRVAPRSDSL
jgi:hypothetical protein